MEFDEDGKLKGDVPDRPPVSSSQEELERGSRLMGNSIGQREYEQATHKGVDAARDRGHQTRMDRERNFKDSIDKALLGINDMNKSSPGRILRNIMRGKVDGDELNDLLFAINRDLKSEWIRELLKSDCRFANSSGVFLLEEYVGDAISLYDVAIPLQSEIDPWKRRVFIGYVIKQNI